MFEKLRRSYSQLGSSAVQLGVLGIGAHVDTPASWAVTAGLISAISLLAWTLALRHLRAICDTPTSKVASAAQGYVELQGIGRAFDGMPVMAKLSMTPCLWFRYRTEKRSDKKWVTEDAGESDASFILDDGTGQCLVDPEWAQVLTSFKRTWTQGDRRHTEWRIHEGDEVYAIGSFITRGSVDLQLNVNEDTKALLADWKRDPARLKRFDLNEDGEIDLREWELARAQARREVLAQHREARQHDEVHLMHRPIDRRLFLISTLAPERIALQFRLWSAFHLVAFFSGLGALGWLWRQGLY